MTNAKNEFLQAIEGLEVTDVNINFAKHRSRWLLSQKITLSSYSPVYGEEELQNFLGELDFEYNESNYFTGSIYCKDGTVLRKADSASRWTKCEPKKPVMTNVKNEFLDATNGREILCAIITESMMNDGLSPNPDTNELNGICLKEGFSDKDFRRFLSQLDYEYHNGYGNYAIGGTIWLKDGSWIERYEYDGKTEWVDRKLPTIPSQLRSIN